MYLYLSWGRRSATFLDRPVEPFCEKIKVTRIEAGPGRRSEAGSLCVCLDHGVTRSAWCGRKHQDVTLCGSDQGAKPFLNAKTPFVHDFAFGRDRLTQARPTNRFRGNIYRPHDYCTIVAKSDTQYDKGRVSPNSVSQGSSFPQRQREKVVPHK